MTAQQKRDIPGGIHFRCGLIPTTLVISSDCFRYYWHSTDIETEKQTVATYFSSDLSYFDLFFFFTLNLNTNTKIRKLTIASS